MAKPLDDDFNFNISSPSPITEGGVTTFSGPKQAKGGVFSTADFALVKRALHVYKDQLVRSQESERETDPEISAIASLLHRLGRVS